jgi:predicted DNA-binding protein
MTRPRGSEPRIKTSIHLSASLYQRLREHAERTGSSIGRLFCDGALAELERIEALALIEKAAP